MARLALAFFALISESVFAAVGSVKVLEYSAHPDTSNNFAEARFSAVIPSVQLRGILFLAGGTDSDARPWLNYAHWRELADKEHLVLIAAFLRGAGEAYEVASRGSGQALLDAIATFAKEGGRPELNQLPIIMYGHSAGAQFGFNFACWKPDRVRAIVCVKSGPLPEPPRGVSANFAALFIVGERDQPGRVREVARSFAAGRSKGARWCLALQPNAGHGAEGCRDLAEAFIQAINSAAPERPRYAELAASDNLQTTATTDSNWSWLPNDPFSQVWRGFVKGVLLQHLLTLPDEEPPKQLSWRPITPLPERVDRSKERVKFEYAVSLPENRASITGAKVTASSPAISATATRRADREWSIAGECDFRQMPLGPFKSQLQVELVMAEGTRKRGDLSLYTRLTGPVSVSPSSIYYGVIARDATVAIDVAVRGDEQHPIRSCEAVSSDPQFLSAAVSPSEKSGEYRAKCTIQSGSRIGARHGRVTFRIKADIEYLITVPFYGFVKK